MTVDFAKRTSFLPPFEVHMIDMKASSHGAVRGSDFDRRSSQFEGRFGRIFRSFQAPTPCCKALKTVLSTPWIKAILVFNQLMSKPPLVASYFGGDMDQSWVAPIT